jgi:DNA-binding PadR family transcriptional regulator
MSLRHTLLGILDWTTLHGYALRELAKGYSWIYPMTNANIYPTLRQLEGEGFVEHRSEVHEGRLRKVYQITEAGREELRRWLSDPTEQRGVYRDPELLKICLLREGGMAAPREWMRASRDRLETATRDTERFLEQSGAGLPKFTRLVAEHGLDILHLRLAWYDRVLGEIENELGGAAEPPALAATEAAGSDRVR